MWGEEGVISIGVEMCVGEKRCVMCIRGGEVCGKKRGDAERVRRNNRREEMTREEKRCGEEGDGLMDSMDGMY